MVTKQSNFAETLLAKGPSPSIPPEDNIFEFLIGEWDFDWCYNEGTQMERKEKGEWLFSWIIDGYAIQDVFVCPTSLREENHKNKEIAYGTKLRVYNNRKKLWDIYYVCNDYSTVLEGKKIGDKIVLNSVVGCKYQVKWIYSDINPTSFCWQSAISKDNGRSWVVQGKLYATKRK